MPDWPIARLEEAASRIGMGPFGSSIKVETFVPTGLPVISGQHLWSPRLRDLDFNFVTKQHADRLKGANVFRGDVIFTHAGSIGQVSYIPPDSRFERYVLSQRQFYLRPDTRYLIPAFLVYYFRSPLGRAQLLANASSTGVPSIAQPVSYLRSLHIRLPPLSEQRAIAEVLGALDDKIEANVHMATIDEALAQAYATKWLTGNDAPLTTLEDVADISKGASYRSVDLASGDGWLVSLKCAGRDGAFHQEGLKPFRGAAKDSQVVGQGDIVVAQTDLTQRGSVIGRPYRVDPLGSAGRLVASLDFAVVRPRGALTREVLFAVLSQQEFRDHALGFCNGTTVLHMNSRALPSYEFPLPKAEVIRTLTSVMGPILEHAGSVRRECVALSSLRDALLPRLLSGEIRVPQAEPLIEAAL